MIDRRKKQTIRKGVRNVKNNELFLYGSLDTLDKARGYCSLHKCYLSYSNISEKGCRSKHCMHLKTDF